MTEAINKLLTVEDVMANLRISRPTLYRLLKSGQLIPVRIGKRTLFDPADIRDFIDASKQAPAERKLSKKPSENQNHPAPKAGRPKGTKQKPAATTTAESEEEGRKEQRSKENFSGEEDKQGRLL